jgi:hypothetical protein
LAANHCFLPYFAPFVRKFALEAVDASPEAVAFEPLAVASGLEAAANGGLIPFFSLCYSLVNIAVSPPAPVPIKVFPEIV